MTETKRRPNRQRWNVHYVWCHVDEVDHRVMLPLSKEPHINENGWLEIGGFAANGKHISGLEIEKVGPAFYDQRFGEEVQA